MFTDTDLRELVEFTAPEPVLSVYLNTNPTEGNADAYRLQLRNILKDVNLPEDVEAIDHYVNREHDWSGRGMALFSCAPKSFFRAYSLAVPVPNLIHVGGRPSVKPLADLLDSFGGYGVILVDKQGVRLFHFHLGELHEQEGMAGETVKHIKHGSASTVFGSRAGAAGKTTSADEVIDRNMRDSADFAVHFLEEKHLRRILIGGTDENVAAFRALLPKAWQSLIVGTFPMPMTASHTEVLNRALQIGTAAEIKREAQVISNLITSAAKGIGAVVGFNETLDAVNHDRVRTLIITEGLRKTGYQCEACGALSTILAENCQLCGEPKLHRIQDVVDSATGRVMHNGAEVDIVHENPDMQKIEGFGAILRY